MQCSTAKLKAFFQFTAMAGFNVKSLLHVLQAVFTDLLPLKIKEELQYHLLLINETSKTLPY